ncbi:MAG TPA: GDSL-type esterase/lipase family protein [Candidatus Saccharimonadia bacterium]|nr:GDSL-type esterase/lipase family protein [Candidatus Saccharimonadia bacterium]
MAIDTEGPGTALSDTRPPKSRRTQKLRRFGLWIIEIPLCTSLLLLRNARRALRELRSWRTTLLVLVSITAAIPLALIITPGQDVVAAGQHVTVGAKPPDLSLSGPAQVVQIGNTKLDIPKYQVYGPIRPRLQKGPFVRNEAAGKALNPQNGSTESAFGPGIWGGILRYLGLLAMFAVGIALGLYAILELGRVLFALRRQSRRRPDQVSLTLLEFRQRYGQPILRRAVCVLAGVLTALALCLTGTAVGAHGLAGAESLADIFGTTYVTPSPTGPVLTDVEGAVAGDSRVSEQGGPLVANPTQDDRDCGRSSDSLAEELKQQLLVKVANLACPSATVAAGLRGSQLRSNRYLPPQVGLLKNIKSLKFVVVMIGANDVRWADAIGYCYIVVDCSDPFMHSEFEYLLTDFDQAYGQLLRDLNELPTHPQIIIVKSYEALSPDAVKLNPSCPDLQGPPGIAGVKPLNEKKIAYLRSLGDELNAVLTTGAEKYHFDVATPHLTRLCEPSPPGLGPDIRGVADPDRFHPTGLGEIRLAEAVLPLIIKGRTKPN